VRVTYFEPHLGGLVHTNRVSQSFVVKLVDGQLRRVS
jgi:hypothetical protein